MMMPPADTGQPIQRAIQITTSGMAIFSVKVSVALMDFLSPGTAATHLVLYSTNPPGGIIGFRLVLNACFFA